MDTKSEPVPLINGLHIGMLSHHFKSVNSGTGTPSLRHLPWWRSLSNYPLLRRINRLASCLGMESFRWRAYLRGNNPKKIL